MVGMALPEVLVHDLQSAGYYPQLTQGILADSLYDEPVLAHFVHIDTMSTSTPSTGTSLPSSSPRLGCCWPTSTTTRMRSRAPSPVRSRAARTSNSTVWAL